MIELESVDEALRDFDDMSRAHAEPALIELDDGLARVQVQDLVKTGMSVRSYMPIVQHAA